MSLYSEPPMAPTKLKVKLLIGLQNSVSMGASLNASANTLRRIHLAVVTLASSLFLEKPGMFLPQALHLFPQILAWLALASFVFSPLSLGRGLL